MNQFDEHASRWLDPNGPMRSLHHIHVPRMKFIKQHLDDEALTILDGGCAAGLISLDLAKMGHHVTGIDQSAELIRIARNEAEKRELSIQFDACAIEQYQADVSYDMIILSEVLEHVEDHQQAIEHLSTYLKPGGKLIISTINRNLKSFLGAIVGAEYILNLVPKGTHRFRDFIQPSELINPLLGKKYQLTALSGIHYNPFTSRASLTRNVDINYIFAVTKPL